MFPVRYKFSKREKWELGEYQLIPIRYADMLDIMEWRNQQVYHLRQSKPLTKEDQQVYFDTVVRSLFEQDFPSQILFSYLERGKLIGYGGLVHINWVDRNAEISFIMDTELEENFFEFHWQTYLRMLEQVAFQELNFHKIFTYAFDLRPRLYDALTGAGYKHEATLREHCLFEGKFIDVLYHAKFNRPRLRYATIDDLDVTYKWAIDANIRKYSFSQSEIRREEHSRWFSQKLDDCNCFFYILEDISETPLGSIRIDIKDTEGVISYLIDSAYFGKGLGTAILRLVEQKIKDNGPPVDQLVGYVLKENLASIKIFLKLGYDGIEENNNLKFFKRLR